MSEYVLAVHFPSVMSKPHVTLAPAAPRALADGSVADDAEPVAAQAVVACPDTHRDDGDAMTTR